MFINNIQDFHALLLNNGVTPDKFPQVSGFEECIQFYSTMCGCEKELKEMKYNECQEKYKNFILNEIHSIEDQLLKDNHHCIFTFDGVVIADIIKKY